MNVRTGPRKARWLAGVLGLTALLLAPTATYAIFPPVIQNPPPVVVPVVVPAGNPVVVPAGVPVDPPVTTHSTPEPASVVTGLIGVAFGVYFLRRKKLAPV